MDCSINYQSLANFTDYDLFQFQCGIIFDFSSLNSNSLLLPTHEKASRCPQISFLGNEFNATTQYENNGSCIGPFRENLTKPHKLCKLKGIYRNWDDETPNQCEGLKIGITK